MNRIAISMSYVRNITFFIGKLNPNLQNYLQWRNLLLPGRKMPSHLKNVRSRLYKTFHENEKYHLSLNNSKGESEGKDVVEHILISMLSNHSFSVAHSFISLIHMQ